MSVISETVMKQVPFPLSLLHASESKLAMIGSDWYCALYLN